MRKQPRSISHERSTRNDRTESNGPATTLKRRQGSRRRQVRRSRGSTSSSNKVKYPARSQVGQRLRSRISMTRIIGKRDLVQCDLLHETGRWKTRLCQRLPWADGVEYYTAYSIDRCGETKFISLFGFKNTFLDCFKPPNNQSGGWRGEYHLLERMVALGIRGDKQRNAD